MQIIYIILHNFSHEHFIIVQLNIQNYFRNSILIYRNYVSRSHLNLGKINNLCIILFRIANNMGKIFELQLQNNFQSTTIYSTLK